MPLRITLHSGSQLANVPIAVEVIGSDFETKWQGAILIGQTESIDGLDADRYSVRASLPSGQKFTKICKLEEGETKNVNIKLSGSTRSDSLEWASLCKPEAMAEAEQRESKLRSVWLRLWGCGPDGRWDVMPWPIQNAEREPGLVQYKFNLSEAGQYYLQVGGPTMLWRMIALPATQVLVLITGARHSENQDEADSAVEVCVTSMEHDAETLLGYLSRGGIEGANLVSKHVAAADPLHGKRRNPTAAAVAGYFMLATGKLESAHQIWTNNLADWMTWLPDGAVINAYYSMRGATLDLVHARRRLLEAASRGVPVYTHGLRLLLDGLGLFANDPEHAGPDVSAAHRRVRSYAAAADWHAITTTFIGEDPSSPGASKLGKPDEPRHVVFIADVDEDDLAWKRRPSRRRSSSTRTRGAATTGLAADASFDKVGKDILIYQQEGKQVYSAPPILADQFTPGAATELAHKCTVATTGNNHPLSPTETLGDYGVFGSPQISLIKTRIRTDGDIGLPHFGRSIDPNALKDLDTGWTIVKLSNVIFDQSFSADYSERAGYKAEESEPNPETARRAALGEAAEPTQDAPAREATSSPPVMHTLSPEASLTYARYQSEREQGIILRPRSIETDERTIARLFRAATSQTQAEQMSDAATSSSGDRRASELRGLALHGLAVERIIGASDLVSVSFLHRGLAAARTVGRVRLGVSSGARAYATGFMVSPRLFLTNNHVIQTAEQARDGLVEFDYQDGSDGRLLSPTRIDLDPDAFFLTSRELDFTLVAVDDAGAGREFGWNHLKPEQGKILIGEYFSIVQHAGGAPKQVSLRENQLVGIDGNFLHYQSDTTSPCSGAPLFNDQWEVVGMHHSGIPAANTDGRALTHDGAVWKPEMGASEVRIIAYVGIRASSIVNFLQTHVLPPHATVFRDELLFLKPPN